MKRLTRRQVALAGCMACLWNTPLASAAQATTSAPPPEAQQLLGSGAKLQGSARLRALGFLIYQARLWVAEGFDPQRFETQPLVLELIYARSLKGPLIAERSVEEMRRGAPISEADAQRWLAFMNEAFPDVNEGDRLVGVWRAGEGVSSFHFNGGPPRSLRDAAFGPRFFGIWLARHSSQPAMRQQLLGLAS